MKRPPLGLCLPVALERTIDADTIVVRLKEPRTGRLGIHEIHVRLLGSPGCWAPEKRGATRAAGMAAMVRTADLLSNALDDLAIYIPPDDSIDLLSIFTLGRVLAHVFAGPVDVGAQLVAEGHATGEKVKPAAAAKAR